MIHLIRDRVTLVWFVLVAATTASWGFGHGAGFDDSRFASVAIIVIAFVKTRLVILDFMEIRHAPVAMRLVGEAWCMAICTALITLYLGSVAPGPH